MLTDTEPDVCVGVWKGLLIFVLLMSLYPIQVRRVGQNVIVTLLGGDKTQEQKGILKSKWRSLCGIFNPMKWDICGISLF